MGLFMAFQYPVAIPGVTITKYLRMVMNAHREARGEAEVSLKDFRKLVEAGDGAHPRAARVLLALPQRRLLRRREEAPGDPAARAPAARRSRSSTRPTRAWTSTRSTPSPTASTRSPPSSDLGVLIITHYQRILHLVQPDRVSIMFEGRIVKEGGPELVEQLEREGYGWIRDEVGGGGLMHERPRRHRAGPRVPVARPRGPRLPRLARRRRRRRAPSSTRWTTTTPHHRGSVHRGVYPLAAEATELLRGRPRARRALRELGRRRRRSSPATSPRRSTSSPTRGADATSAPATASCVTEMEHHSNFVPWQLLAQRRGAALYVVGVDDEGRLRWTSSTPCWPAATSRSSPSRTSPTCSARSTRSRRSCAAPTPPARSSSSTARRPCRRSPSTSARSTPTSTPGPGTRPTGPTGIGVLHGRARAARRDAAVPRRRAHDRLGRRSRRSRWARAAGEVRGRHARTIAEAIGLGAAVDFLQAIGMEHVRDARARARRPTRSSACARSRAHVHGPPDADAPRRARLLRARRHAPARRRRDPRPRGRLRPRRAPLRAAAHAAPRRAPRRRARRSPCTTPARTSTA